MSRRQSATVRYGSYDVSPELPRVFGGGSELVIAIDYGTTHTGAAYATPNSGYVPIENIDCIFEWGDRMGNHKKIPSKISFSRPSAAKEQQWGSDLSEDAVAMVHTKLELEAQDVSMELHILAQTLEGMKNLRFEELRSLGRVPAYTERTAEQIITAYLTCVFKCLLRETEDFSQEYLDRTPTTIVITVPTDWSYEARNATYKAFVAAGFNRASFPMLGDLLFVTEPEAAAIYTARYLKEDRGVEFLKPGECFILCDAGGGTVDVVSYRVKQLEPTLELERVGRPTGDRCGAIHIDQAFKRWLGEWLGEDNFRRLDSSYEFGKISSHTVEGKAMRALMRKFESLKVGFEPNSGDMFLDLPAPLDKHTQQHPGRVDSGQIRITSKLMAQFFHECIGKIIALVQFHVKQISDLNQRCKNVFLVGGFGESPFLQEKIRESLKLRKIELRIPDTSQTAVVRGAVICGTERHILSTVSAAKPCPRNYGIASNEKFSLALHDEEDKACDPITGEQVALGRMFWLFGEGDLIQSNEPRTVHHPFDLMVRSLERRSRRVVIYSYDGPDPPSSSLRGRGELREAIVLPYDLGNLQEARVLQRRGGRQGSYYVALMDLALTLSATGIEAKLSCNGKVIAVKSELWNDR